MADSSDVMATVFVIVVICLFLFTPLGDILLEYLGFDASSVYEGDGTTENPYQIKYIEQLDEMRNHMSSSFILMNDLDFNNDLNYLDPVNKLLFTTGSGWEPIGSLNTGFFTGELDGNNCDIRGLYINEPHMMGYDGVGLFGAVNGVTIHDLGLVNVDITAVTVQYYQGALYGTSTYTSIAPIHIYNVYATEVVKGNGFVGGLIGVASGAGATLIEDCYADVEVWGDYYNLGGFIGSLSSEHSVARNCYATGNVYGTYWNEKTIGTLYGGESNGTFENCYGTGDIYLYDKMPWE